MGSNNQMLTAWNSFNIISMIKCSCEKFSNFTLRYFLTVVECHIPCFMPSWVKQRMLKLMVTCDEKSVKDTTDCHFNFLLALGAHILETYWTLEI